MKPIEKIVSKTIHGIVSQEMMGWPPVCWGVFYQPERPKAETPAKQNENTSESEAE